MTDGQTDLHLATARSAPCIASRGKNVSPVSVTLSTGREVSAVVGVEVAAVSGSEHAANVRTRWTAHCRRSVVIALRTVCVTWTVEGFVVANV